MCKIWTYSRLFEALILDTRLFKDARTPWKDMRKHFCKVPDGIKDGHLPSRVAHDDELLSGHDPGGDDGDSD